MEIKARDIAVWAARIDARRTLGELIRRLVNSTGRGLSKVDFHAGDQAERHGWDGIVGASSPTPWIPEGESGWELSCNARPTGKADDDFAHRVRTVPPGERRARTFVFATARDWPGKTRWANDKKKLDAWHDVRAYDASDLEQWIEQSVPAQIWVAERFGPAGWRLSIAVTILVRLGGRHRAAVVAPTLRTRSRTPLAAVPRVARRLTDPTVQHRGGFQGRGHRFPWRA